MKRKLATALGALLCLVLLPVLVMNLTITIKSYLDPERVPDFLGLKPFVVLTSSMEPEIAAGDLVLTQTTDPAELKVGDIISYRDGTAVITHRVAALTESDGRPAFLTKGDANATNDAKPVTYDRVESVFRLKLGGLGHVAMFMQTPLGIMVFVGGPLLLFALYDAIRRKLDRLRAQAAGHDAQAELARLRAELAQRRGEAAPRREPEEVG